MSYTIVGVVGHIDHGKTSLVRRLTGTDTDTHPEEKRRGITIDLGFAAFSVGEHDFALIDAPGHQKYVGNLLAGVSRVDIGLLVVACDQGIQKQTLEHAAIIKALGVEKLIVALSRIDLSDEQARSALTEELELFLADFGFSEIPIIPLSAFTGDGLEQLKSQLCQYAQLAEKSSAQAQAPFRMPVDRVLNIPGRGCVAAGTVWSGKVEIGDSVGLAGTEERLRVRQLEVHGGAVSDSKAGRRTAINLTGLKGRVIQRGDELVSENTYVPVDRIVAEVTMFPDARAIRCPATVQLHTATTACAAKIAGVRQLAAGQKATVVVQPERKIVATLGQLCLFRLPYPVGSFAGGRVLAAVESAHERKRGLVELGDKLRSSDKAQRLSAWIDYLGEMEVEPVWCQLQLGVPRDQTDEIVQAVLNRRDALQIENRLVSCRTMDRICRYVQKLLSRQAEDTNDAWLVEESVVQRLRSLGSSAVVRAAIQKLVDEGMLVRFNTLIAVASDKTVLSKKQRARMQQIIELFAGQRTPPSSQEAADQLQMPLDSFSSLVRFATEQKILTDLGHGLQISTDVLVELCGELRELFRSREALTVAEIRDHWRVTRKHAIPLLEFCDQVGATRRIDNTRVAGPQLEQILSEQVIEQD